MTPTTARRRYLRSHAAAMTADQRAAKCRARETEALAMWIATVSPKAARALGGGLRVGAKPGRKARPVR